MTTRHAPWPLDAWTDPILIVRVSSLGDVVLATSVIPLILGRRPDLRLDFLTSRPYLPILQCTEGLRRVITADADREGREAAEYGQVLDLQGGTKGRRVVARAAPGAQRIGYDRASLRRRWTVLCGNRCRGVSPLVTRFAEAVTGRKAGDAEAGLPRIKPPATLLEAHRDRLRAGRSGRGPSILISPGASRPLKAIPAGLTRSLMEGLSRAGAFVIRLDPPRKSSPNEAQRPSAWQEGPDAVLSFRGSLSSVAALLACVDGVISSDSGILHLATAVGTPAVGLYGPTSPTLGFSPLGRSRAVGVRLDCRPCHVHGPRVCWLGHQRCWRDLSTKDIIKAALEVAEEG